MIDNWNEIEQRYEKIKDNNKRANWKLEELGYILSSAYLINPNRASKMWQYVIEQNIKIDIEYAKYYAAQVYIKNVKYLGKEKASNFLCMNADRIKIAFRYGYDGRSVFTSGYYVIGNLLQKYMYDEAVDIYLLIEERLNNVSSRSNTLFFDFFVYMCDKLEAVKGNNGNLDGYDLDQITVLLFYERLSKTFVENEYQLILFCHKCLYLNDVCTDEITVSEIIEHLTILAKQYGNLDILLCAFIYLEKDYISELEETIYNCLKIMGTHCSFFFYSSQNAEQERIKEWYRDEIFQSNKLMGFINRTIPLNEWIKNVLDECAKNNNWEKYLFILANGINHSHENDARRYIQYIEEELSKYDDLRKGKIVIENGMAYKNRKKKQIWVRQDDEYERLFEITVETVAKMPIITQENAGSFWLTIGKLCLETKKSSVYELLYDTIISHVSKDKAKIEMLRKNGLSLVPDNRSTAERLNEYVKEKLLTEPNGFVFQDNMFYYYYHIVEREERLYSILSYSFWLRYPDIIRYLFLYVCYASHIKRSIIFSAIYKDDENTIEDIMEYLAQSVKLQGDQKRNIWRIEVKDVLISTMNIMMSPERKYFEIPGLIEKISDFIGKIKPLLYKKDLKEVEIKLESIKKYKYTCNNDRI